MILEYLIFELYILISGSFSIMLGNKGIILSFILMTILNIHVNFEGNFLYWELIIILFAILALVINFYLDKRTNKLRTIKVTAGSAATLISSGIIIPLIPGLLLWSVFIGLPLIFTYREIPKILYIQIIFKFIFFTGWIIIGNIIY